ncbi:hypothetical protein LTR78_002027 [Recurvomyces mirabilis]|uniref:tRNA(Ile)-lysidine synthetase n=1 Tax=Recurvomyces mirabilis TaxID=574656 RepID=A0AAE0WU88_9PEZI|nr:hypothetical protein LTR78_002027 [Recurvomyces mirabilis]KAK5160485.1 hypothetical protein LTS14_001497 [Recurvomyces mirabilis]
MEGIREQVTNCMVAQRNEPSPSLTAFIVDHKLRPGSTEEAKFVAHELRCMNVQPRILTLDWVANGIDPASTVHLEHAARRLRYQAMGKACREHDINTLLVAHHADDQAETVLMRLVSNYHGSGLQGIKAVKPLPECHGMYGIHASGTPRDTNEADPTFDRILLEGGGVSIYRPLLAYSKADLVSHCHDAGVRWFGDETNDDKRFALRNTVRYMLHRDVLPMALRKSRLLEIATKLRQEEEGNELCAQQGLVGMPLELDMRCGRLLVRDFNISRFTALLTISKDIKIRAIALRRLLALVAPTDTIQLQDVYTVLVKIATQAQSSFQIAGVDLVYDNGRRGLTIQRQMPNARELKAGVIALTPENSAQQTCALGPSAWHLWDCRYWLRVSHATSIEEHIIARFLTPNDLASLRQRLSDSEKVVLGEALSPVPGSLRYTVPILVLQSPAVEQGDPEVEKIVALPTLGWSIDGWYQWPMDDALGTGRVQGGYWDVRYRKVDLEATDHHDSYFQTTCGRSSSS